MREKAAPMTFHCKNQDIKPGATAVYSKNAAWFWVGFFSKLSVKMDPAAYSPERSNQDL
jgi:hypothetical protein